VTTSSTVVYVIVRVGSQSGICSKFSVYSGAKRMGVVSKQLCVELDKLLHMFPFDLIYVDIRKATYDVEPKDDKPWEYVNDEQYRID
jgi:hypothetical protein